MKLTIFFLGCLSCTTRLYSQVASPDLPRQTINETRLLNARKAALIRFQYFVIKADSNTYGYRIYADGNLYIEQRSIPSLTGNMGFPDTASAARIARLVIQKIKQGESPPSITPNELTIIKPKQ
jgi:hypothetical protein